MSQVRVRFRVKVRVWKFPLFLPLLMPAMQAGKSEVSRIRLRIGLTHDL